MTTKITLSLRGTLIAETPIATIPPHLAKDKKSDAPSPLPTMNGVPYVPGAAIRGTLRRRLTDMVRATLSPDGSPVFTVDDHFFNVLGGIKGKGGEDKTDIVGAHARRLSNPIIGLFGANSPSWMTGRLSVGHATPEGGCTPEIVGGVRMDDFARDGSALEMLSPAERERWLAMAKATTERSAAKAAGKAAKREITKAKKQGDDEAVKQAKAKEDEAAAALNSLEGVAVNLPLAGYEVIPPGTRLNHRIILSHATEEEVGAFLTALHYWALDPQIGGHKNHLCGMLSGTWTATMRIGFAPSFAPAGEVSVVPCEGMTINGDDGRLEAAMAAFHTSISAGKYDFQYPKKAA